jgi:hypothetical protein
MFGRAANEFADWVTEPLEVGEPEEVLALRAHRFVEFCVSDVPRYQLLFQRTIPNFEPSAESYAPAVRTLESARACLAINDVTQPKHLDLWTALLSGLVAQQVSNDPGGDRWTLLIDEAVAMFLCHVKSMSGTRTSKSKGSTVRTRSTR